MPQRGYAACFVFVMVVLVFTGCFGPTYDEEGLAYVQDYASELMETVNSTTREIGRWLRGLQNLEAEELERMVAGIREVNERYWDQDMPEISEIKEWEVRVRRGIFTTETIPGEDIAEVLREARESTREMTGFLAEGLEALPPGVDLEMLRDEMDDAEIAGLIAELEAINELMNRLNETVFPE